MHMSENGTAQAGSTTTPNDGGNAATAQAGAGSQAAAGSRTFTQDEVNSLLAKERRETEAKFAGFDDFKAKAARLDEIEEASKSDLEKAQASAEKWKARAEKLEADAKRAEEIARAAEEHGVDAAMLARMEGDVGENAAFLKERMAAAQKYPSVVDNGNQGPTAPKSKKEIASMTDRKARHDALVELVSKEKR